MAHETGEYASPIPEHRQVDDNFKAAVRQLTSRISTPYGCDVCLQFMLWEPIQFAGSEFWVLEASLVHGFAPDPTHVITLWKHLVSSDGKEDGGHQDVPGAVFATDSRNMLGFIGIQWNTPAERNHPSNTPSQQDMTLEMYRSLLTQINRRDSYDFILLEEG